jgi:hypothetical protein
MDSEGVRAFIAGTPAPELRLLCGLTYRKKHPKMPPSCRRRFDVLVFLAPLRKFLCGLLCFAIGLML